MTSEKRRRLTVAITAGATLLVLMLFVVVIYQIVRIVVVNGRIRDMEEEIDALEAQIETVEDNLEYLQTEEALQRILIENEYSFK